MSKFVRAAHRYNAFAIALPLAAVLTTGVSHKAMAACVGSVNPLVQAQTATANNGTSVTVECGVATPNTNFPSAPASPASDGNLTVNAGDTTTYKDTSIQGSVGTPFNATTNPNTVNNNMIQFDGHGRTLTVGVGAEVSNERVINGTNGGRGRTTVLMGAATQNATATTTFSAAPAAGTSTVTISGTPSASWVGQSLVFGRFFAGDNDFFPGTALIIQSVDVAAKTVTFTIPIPANFQGSGDASLPLVYNITSNFGQTTTVDGVEYNNAVVNAGTISSKITAAEVNANKSGTASPSTTASSRAITTSVAGTYIVKNTATGIIKATNGSLGNAYAVEGGGAVTELTVNNAGTLLAERTSNVTLTLVSPTATQQATSTSLPGIAAVNLGQANAINIQEELETFTLNNAATGVVRATGDYTAAIVARAEEDVIVNKGLIEFVNAAGNSTSKGYAIGANSNTGAIRELELDNSGTINGDILAVNGASFRYYLLSTETTLAPNGVDDRLLINSQHGQFNSEIVNSGLIKGNLWYANGTHELENTGTITGNIDVEQRDTKSQAAAGVGTLTLLADEDGNATNNTLQGAQYVYRGDKKFVLENEGSITGNINITNASSTITGATFGSGTVTKTVASDNTITNENGATLTGNITIKDVAGAKNTINLAGDGFTGNITATTGAGNNTLNLLGEGTLRGNVSKFTTLNVGELGGGGGGDEDDEDVGGTDWTLQSGKTFEFTTANLLSGSLDVRGTLKANTIVGEDATLLGRGTIIGNVTNNGTIELDDETLHVTGNVSLNDDSKLALAIASGVNGKLAVTGNMSIDDDSKVAPVLDGVMVFTGDSFTVATTTGGITGLPEVTQFALLHWEAELANANKDLVITAEVADASEIEGMSKPGAAAINALLSSENDLGIALLGVEDEEQVAQAGAQLAPETNFATQQAAITLNQSVGQNIDTRLASAGATGGNFGGASGLGMSQKSSEGRSNLGYSDDGSFVAPRSAALWGQAFGAGLDQDTRQSVDGYDARLYGLMAGYDNWIASNTRLGVAVGYANTGIDGKGFTSRNTTDIDSYLVEVYGATKGAGWYVAGRTGFTWHSYDTARVVTVPVAETETGSHDGQQFNASVEVGAPARMSGAVVTPIASLTYSYLDQDGYVENGGLAAQTVSKQTNDSLVSGLGLKALIPIASDTALEGRAVWLHEFADTVQTVTASFAAGGSTFTASGPDTGRDTAALGLGIVANIAPESTFQLNYDANVRQDFIGHVGSVRLTVEY